jgi:uncharacterized membrane protein
MMNFTSVLASFLWATLMLAPGSAQAQMMGGSMMGGMMWLMVILWLLVAVVLVLAIAALIKYIFKK